MREGKGRVGGWNLEAGGACRRGREGALRRFPEGGGGDAAFLDMRICCDTVAACWTCSHLGMAGEQVVCRANMMGLVGRWHARQQNATIVPHEFKTSACSRWARKRHTCSQAEAANHLQVSREIVGSSAVLYTKACCFDTANFHKKKKKQ